MASFKKIFARKNGFGIAEVLVAAAVLGFFCVALNRLQVSNHDTFLRIRGRDGAVEVAQQVLDSLNTVGVASIPSKEGADTTFAVDNVTKSWSRGLGGTATIAYTPTVTVSSTTAKYMSTDSSSYEKVQHVFAKQVNVKVEWNYKGSSQSINVSGVVR